MTSSANSAPPKRARWDTFAMDDDPDTVLAPTVQAVPNPVAWSQSDDETDDLDAGWDERAYAWGTVKIFAALMAVSIAGAVYIAVTWSSSHHHAPAPSAPASTHAQTPVQLSPDDRVVPKPLPPPPPVLTIDEQYLAALRADGITSEQGQSGALGIGHSICRALDTGETRQNVVRDVLRDNASLGLDGAQFLTDTAIRFYCPPPGM